MKQTTPLSSIGGLSQVLTKILNRAGIKNLEDIAELTRLKLKQRVPRLAVRHMVDLGHILQNHELDFAPDDSIRLDVFINQRKLFWLWQLKVYTYKQLEELDHETFVEVMGGPQSAFFRKKKLRDKWLKENNLLIKHKPSLPLT
jgi:hypothetical protein